MEQITRTAAEVLGVIDAALSSLDHSDRLLFSAPERIALMGWARRVRDRMTSFACVLTDEAAQGSRSATGTPLTTLIGLGEGRDSEDAAEEVFEARDLNAHNAVRDAALDDVRTPRHAAAITQGVANLPAGISDEQKARAEKAFMARAPRNTPRVLANMAEEVLAEIAPELVPDGSDGDALLALQRGRACRRRSFAWGDDGDGSAWFRGSLPHLEAAPLISVVEARVESDRCAQRSRYAGTRATKPGVSVIQDQVSKDNLRSPNQRRADALAQIMAERSGDAPAGSVGDKPRIVITIEDAELRPRGG